MLENFAANSDAVAELLNGLSFVSARQMEEFHSYLIDLRNDAAWNSDKVTKFRFDPTSRKQAFEIDHIRFYETASME